MRTNNHNTTRHPSQHHCCPQLVQPHLYHNATTGTATLLSAHRPLSNDSFTLEAPSTAHKTIYLTFPNPVIKQLYQPKQPNRPTPPSQPNPKRPKPNPSISPSPLLQPPTTDYTMTSASTGTATSFSDPPIWPDAASHTFYNWQDGFTDWSINNGSAYVLFEDSTGITAPTADTHKDFQRQIILTKARVYTALKASAGPYWDQFVCYEASEDGGDSITKILRDPVKVFAKFVAHSKATASASAGQILLQDYHCWKWDDTAATLREQVLANGKTVIDLRNRSMIFGSSDYNLSEAMLSAMLHSKLPTAVATFGAGKYRQFVKLVPFQAALLADCDLIPHSAPGKKILITQDHSASSTRVHWKRRMDKDAGPWDSTKGHIWCDNHGWCAHATTVCKGGSKAGNNGRRAGTTKHDRCFVCNEPGHFGRDCPKVSHTDAVEMSKTALITKYASAEIVPCTRNAHGELVALLSLSEKMTNDLILIEKGDCVPSGRNIFVDCGGETSTECDIANLTDVVLYDAATRPKITGFEAGGIEIHAKGMRKFTFPDGKTIHTPCQYSPDFHFNIEATNALADAGISTLVDASTANNQLSLSYEDHGRTIRYNTSAVGKLWTMTPNDKILVQQTTTTPSLPPPPPPPTTTPPTSAVTPATTAALPKPPKMDAIYLRARLGGASTGTVQHLASSFGTSLSQRRDNGNFGLVLGESSQIARPIKAQAITDNRDAGTTIVTDTIGTMQTGAVSGNKYYQSWADPNSQPIGISVYVTCATSHTSAASVVGLQDMMTRSEYPQATLKVITTDGGGEYQGAFDEHCIQNGYQHRTDTAHKKNTGRSGVIECVNRILQTKTRNGIFLSSGNFTFIFGPGTGTGAITGMSYVDYGYVYAGHLIRTQSKALALPSTYSTADKIAWLKRLAPAPWGSICTLKIQQGSPLGGTAVKQFKPRGVTCIYLGIDQSHRYIVVTPGGVIHHSHDVSWNPNHCMQPVPIGAAGIVHHLWKQDGQTESSNTNAISNKTFLDAYNKPFDFVEQFDGLDDFSNGGDDAQDDIAVDNTSNNDIEVADNVTTPPSTPLPPTTEEDDTAIIMDTTTPPPPSPSTMPLLPPPPATPTTAPPLLVMPRTSQRTRTQPALVREDAADRDQLDNDYTFPFAVQDAVTALYQGKEYAATVTEVQFDTGGPQDDDTVTVAYKCDDTDCVYERENFNLLKKNPDDHILVNQTKTTPSDQVPSYSTILATWVSEKAHPSIQCLMNTAGTNLRWEILTGREPLPPQPPLPLYTRDQCPALPKSVREAFSSPDAIHWVYAYVDEIGGQQKQPTYTYRSLTDLRKSGRPINLKMVHTFKFDGFTLMRFKARMVLAAWNLQRGVDYTESYTGTAPASDLKDLTVMAVELGLSTQEMDATKAYINAKMPVLPNGKQVTARLPNGLRLYNDPTAAPTHTATPYEATGSEDELPTLQFTNYIDTALLDLNKPEVGCEVLRAIYGHPSAGFAWSMDLRATFTNKHPERKKCPLTIIQCLSQPSIYRIKFPEGSNKIGIIWVNNDNIRTYVSHWEIHDTFATWLRDVYEMTGGFAPLHELAPATCFGIDFIYSPGQVKLSMAPYAMKLLTTYGMQDCNTVDTPLPAKFNLGKDDCPSTYAEEQTVVLGVQKLFPLQNVATYDDVRTIYRQIIMSANWFATMIAPILKAPVSMLGRVLTNPPTAAFKAAKKLLRFIKGEMQLGLIYRKTRDWGPNEWPQLTYHSDASFADVIDSAKTQGGYCASFANQPVSTFVSRQSGRMCVSTFDAERYFAFLAALDIIYKRQLFTELGFPPAGPTPLYIDNQATVLDAGSEIPKFSQQSKHFRVAERTLDEQVYSGNLDIREIDGKKNRADALTKALPAVDICRYNAEFHADGIPVFKSKLSTTIPRSTFQSEYGNRA